MTRTTSRTARESVSRSSRTPRAATSASRSTVSGGGDNSSQCVGIQGVANTGNAQNLTGVVQYGSEADDFDFEDLGSSIEVSPENSTTCDQQVNQAASAFGG